MFPLMVQKFFHCSLRHIAEMFVVVVKLLRGLLSPDKDYVRAHCLLSPCTR